MCWWGSSPFASWWPYPPSPAQVGPSPCPWWSVQAAGSVFLLGRVCLLSQHCPYAPWTWRRGVGPSLPHTHSQECPLSFLGRHGGDRPLPSHLGGWNSAYQMILTSKNWFPKRKKSSHSSKESGMSPWLPWRTWRRRATFKSAGRLKLGTPIDFDFKNWFLKENIHDIPSRSQECPLKIIWYAEFQPPRWLGS